MNLHVFEEWSGGFSLNYWSSNKTLLLQGNSGKATLIENKIDNIIEKLWTKPAQTEKIMEVINPESKMKGENKIVTKKKTPLTDKKTDQNIKLIWDAINDITESLKKVLISVNK